MRSHGPHSRYLTLLAVGIAIAALAPLASAGSGSRISGRAEPAAAHWNGRTFESAYQLRRHLNARGIDFERFLRRHPRLAAAVGLERLRWANRGFYTKRSMAAWLGARGRTYAVWRARNPSAARILARNSYLSRNRATRTSRREARETAATVERFGIAAGGNTHNLSDADLARELDAYRAVGSGWIRLDVNWSLIQRGGPTSYEWEPFDRIVQAAAARGLRVLAGVLYTPEWARPGTPDSTYPPADLAAYAEFCRAAVARYAPMGVRHWEVWNEPNAGFWRPQPDPERYTEMLRSAYAAIKAADPEAFVVSAGLAPYGAHGQAGDGHMNPLTFLERMYAAGAAGSFDALGWHPYNYTGLFFHPASAWSQLAETSPSVRSIMQAHGDGAKQVWGTEFGAPTGTSPDAVPEAAQAQLLEAGFSRWQAWDWAGPLFWYSFRDLGTNGGDREQNFGLLRHDYSPKASFGAYQRIATR